MDAEASSGPREEVNMSRQQSVRGYTLSTKSGVGHLGNGTDSNQRSGGSSVSRLRPLWKILRS